MVYTVDLDTFVDSIYCAIFAYVGVSLVITAVWLAFTKYNNKENKKK